MKASEIYHQRFLALNPGIGNLHRRNSTGAAHELMVAAYLLKRGYDVFRSESPCAVCDLIVVKDDLTLRVEVKTGYYNISGTTSHTSIKNHGRFDILAVVFPDGKIVFTPEIQ